MDNAVFVGIFQGVANLGDDGEDFLLVEVAFFGDVSEGLAFYELRDEV